MKLAQVAHVIGQGNTESNIKLGFGRGKSKHKPTVVEWGDNRFLVGEHVFNYTDTIEGFGFYRLTQGSDSVALTYATLGELLEPGSHVLNMAVGLPVEAMEQDKALMNKIRKWLVGDHVFWVDGEQYRVTIPQAGGIAQPVAAYFSWGYNDQGEWIRGKQGKNAETVVVDIGRNTSDWTGVKNGALAHNYTGGSVGMRYAIEQMQKSLERYRLNYSPQEIDMMLRSKPSELRGAEIIKVDDFVKSALDNTAVEILGGLKSVIGNGRKIENLLGCGGGILLLNEQITRAYPFLEVLDNPVFAPAIGLVRAARRRWKTETVVGMDWGDSKYKAALLEALK